MPRAALFALLLIPSLAAQTPAPDTAGVEITIHVFDQSTTAGIADAKIELSGGEDSLPDKKTNSSGDCIARLRPGQHYFVQVTALGYPRGTQSFRQFNAGAKSATVSIPSCGLRQ